MNEPLRLGPGPSLLGDDPASEIQKSAGYEVSDFNGAFTEGAVFQPTRHFKALGPIKVVRAGSIEVKGALCVYDPLDANPGETIFTFRRDVPAGRHDVFVARTTGIIASLVRFKDAFATRWSPALFTTSAVCPRPPLLPMFTTRFAVSFADAEAAADGPPGNAAKALDAIRGGEPVVGTEGFVALDVGGVGQYASWFGEDESGEVVALATEYGRLRELTVESVRVPVHDAMAGGVTLEDRSKLRAANDEEEGFQIWLRPSPPTLEQLRIESERGAEREPDSITHEGVTTIFQLDEPPAGADVIRLDFAGISRPLLRLDPGSVARKLERWREQDLLAVEPASIPVLAQRFCDEKPTEIRDWLVDQEEVEDLFI